MSGLVLQGLEKDITEMMQDTVTVAHRGTPAAGAAPGRGYAKPIYQPAQTYKCLILYGTRMIRSLQGEVKVASARIYFADQLDIKPDDQVIFPDGTTAPIINVKRAPDEYGKYLQMCDL